VGQVFDLPVPAWQVENLPHEMSAMRDKQKIRVEFRKNREKTTRLGNLAQQAGDESTSEQTHDQLAGSERLSGKGRLSRRRTIIAAEGDATGDSPQRVIDVSKCLTGRVLSSAGLTTVVRSSDGRRFECTVRKVLRTMSRDERNIVIAGDEVLFQPTTADEGVIERVNPRRGVLARGSQNREHILVANIDQVAIVVSAAEPAIKPHLVDRFLVSAAKGNVAAIICINKIDLVDPADLQNLCGIYAQIGNEVVLVSAERRLGLDRLRAVFRNRQTVVAGQSGVGKSSLLNAIQPGLSLPTGEVSDWTKKGKHTTRNAVLYELDFGGWVVDTPGIRQMELWDVHPEEIEGYFVEFRPFVRFCKFPNCRHLQESGCGIQSAVARGLISTMRYESYRKLTLGDGE
jgi:ribosome biogenesis GTPase